LATADSIAPEPLAAKTITSFEVPKTTGSRSSTRANSASKAGARW
jgi:hypothetical protein